jgi:hypothetical protein
MQVMCQISVVLNLSASLIEFVRAACFFGKKAALDNDYGEGRDRQDAKLSQFMAAVALKLTSYATVPTAEGPMLTTFAPLTVLFVALAVNFAPRKTNFDSWTTGFPVLAMRIAFRKALLAAQLTISATLTTNVGPAIVEGTPFQVS